MMCAFLLAIMSVICYVKINYQVSPSMAFPDELRKWCPHSQFCEDIPDNHKSPSELHDDDVIPCCSSCSCTEDCGRKRNCCRYEYDVYRIDETFDTICKQLNALSETESPTRDEPFYHIIDKCPNRSEICISSNELLSPSFSPVFSKETGMLYYDRKCATCHAQNEIIDLRQVVDCEKLTVSYFPSFAEVRKGSLLSDCVPRFIIPDHIDISTEVIFPNIIKTCKHSKPMSTEYADLCNYFNATLHTNRRTKYRNVFCYLCSLDEEDDLSGWLQSNEYCPAHSYRQTKFPVTFTILFINPVIDDDKAGDGDQDYHDERDRMIWCGKTGTKLPCRPVFCPEGQDYYRGKCRYIGDKWYFKYFRMDIKLVLSPGIDGLSPGDLDLSQDPSRNTVHLDLKEFDGFKVALFYNTEKYSTNIKYFVAMFSKETFEVEPNNLIMEMKKSLERVWILTINGRDLLVSAEFNQLIKYEPLHANDIMTFHEPLDSRLSHYFNTRENDVVTLIHADVPVDYMKDLLDAVFLTKLFFCNIVELEEHEVEDKPPILLLLNQTKYFESGEFVRSFKGSGTLRARVCLNDLKELTKSSGSGMRVWLLWFYLIFATLYMN